MNLQYVDNKVASLLMELLTVQMLTGEPSIVKLEALMETKDTEYLNSSIALYVWIPAAPAGNTMLKYNQQVFILGVGF